VAYRIFLDLPNLHKLKDAKGKTWYFEWHNGCGLLMTNKKGDVIDGYPPEDSPFWPAFNLWDDGRRAGEGTPNKGQSS
jgi:hypothetical protein